MFTGPYYFLPKTEAFVRNRTKHQQTSFSFAENMISNVPSLLLTYQANEEIMRSKPWRQSYFCQEHQEIRKPAGWCYIIKHMPNPIVKDWQPLDGLVRQFIIPGIDNHGAIYAGLMFNASLQSIRLYKFVSMITHWFN